jgi:RimJ/RimL family protein N-acetyltransferase
MHVLTTARLELRPWRDSDREPFAALNADPEVMRFMPERLERAASDALLDAVQQGLAARGWGVWALARRDGGEFLGYVGLSRVTFSVPFAPCLEVLWRLKRSSWGHGYATEGTRRCLEYAFGTLAAEELYAFTVPANLRSRAVMERLGMCHLPAGDFEHPRLPPAHPLRPHVLYRISREEWLSGTS